MSIRRVVVIVQDQVDAFGLGSMCEVWSGATGHEGTPTFDFQVIAPRPGRIRTSAGFDLHVEAGLDQAQQADVVIAAPTSRHTEPDADVIAALRAAHDRGAYVLAHCSGVFLLGEAGLLDGVHCATHWVYADELARTFPLAKVDADVLYVQDGRIITGAGSAAGIDAALHLLRTEFGARTAASIARHMVVSPHRDGGQAQFIKEAVPECRAETLAPLLTWLAENLDQEVSVATLASRASMSPRTFARRFVAETGTTPHGWITAQRVRLAEEHLESTDLPIETIAQRVGFGNAATLRHQFAKARGLSPLDYRRRFACAD